MTKGQHVGQQSDSLVEDESLALFRAQQKAALAALKPQARRSSYGRGTGDGDVCPLDPSHLRMHILSKQTQYCVNQVHDGRPGKDGYPPTRAKWPVQFFADAVEAWRNMKTVELPVLDLDL